MAMFYTGHGADPGQFRQGKHLSGIIWQKQGIRRLARLPALITYCLSAMFCGCIAASQLN